MQDIQTQVSKEREATANTGELFKGSSHLLYILAFIAMKNFYWIDLARLLGAAIPISFLKSSLRPASLSLIPIRTTTHTNPQAHRDRNLQLHKYKKGNLVINTLDHKQMLSLTRIL